MTGGTRLNERYQIRNQIKLSWNNNPHKSSNFKVYSYLFVKENMFDPLSLHMWIHA